MNRLQIPLTFRTIRFALALFMISGLCLAGTNTNKRKHHHPAAHRVVAQRAPVQPAVRRTVVASKPALASASRVPIRRASLPVSRPVVVGPQGIIAGGPWTQPTYADSTEGDN